MTYTAAQSPMEVENKADRLDPFSGPPVHDSLGEAFFHDHDTIFSEASWGFGDLDGESTLLYTPTASSFQKPLFLSEESPTSTVSDGFASSDLLSPAGQAGSEIKHEFEMSSPDSCVSGQSQASFTDSPGTSPPFAHSPSPRIYIPVQDTPFLSISDTELLDIEGIKLETMPRMQSHSTPASPTVTRQSGDAFDIFASDMNMTSDNHLSNQMMVDYNAEAPRGRLAVPRGPSRTQSTNGLSAQTSRKPATGSSFVKGTVENPFANPNTAPMPPPRGPKAFHEQATLGP